ncbi:MAG TPA: AI-2E family transporter [Thermodesulfovibrionia bacterium]|nr:AI-2E family transporter [Thermodesulfovibrionia bacterium]
MKSDTFRYTLSIIILSLLIYFAYKILSPFLITIVWSGVLTIVFYPLYVYMSRFMRNWLASIITVAVVIIILAGPCYYVINALVGEATVMYDYLKDNGPRFVEEFQQRPLVAKIVERFRLKERIETLNFMEFILNSLQSISQYVYQHGASIFKNLFTLTMNVILMAFTLFYFLIDGHILVHYIKGLLPFSDMEKVKLSRQIKEMVFATVFGGVIVSGIQGLFGGIVFLVLGLSSPVFWGVAMSLAALLPVIGPFIIWAPFTAALLIQGHIGKAIALLICGTFGISMVDQILKPMIIGEKTKLHTLLVFFSVLGGISYFGFIGFILGPLIITLCLSVLKIYIGTAEK